MFVRVLFWESIGIGGSGRVMVLTCFYNIEEFRRCVMLVIFILRNGVIMEFW